jgi:hypothetical protein
MARETRDPGKARRRPQLRRVVTVLTMFVFFVVVASTAVALTVPRMSEAVPAPLCSLAPLPAGASLTACESWARCYVPGVRTLELSGLTPAVARTMVTTVVDISRAYGAEVSLLVPTSAWQAATDTAPLDALMFANDQGFAYDAAELQTYGEDEGSLREIARFTAHEMGHVLQTSGRRMNAYTSDDAVQRIVTRYRDVTGRDEVVAELGTYAWYGSTTQPDRAWAETWAEAFSLYWTDRDAMPAPAEHMVVEVLGALGLLRQDFTKRRATGWGVAARPTSAVRRRRRPLPQRRSTPPPDP